FGSRTTPQMGTQLRRIAAGARELLLVRAAQMFNGGSTGARGNLPQGTKPAMAAAAHLIAENGKVTNRSTGQSLSYAELLRGQHLFEQVIANPALMPATSWRVAGTASPRAAGGAFVSGQHRSARGIRRPGTLRGTVVRPPAFNATLASAAADTRQQAPQIPAVPPGH